MISEEDRWRLNHSREQLNEDEASTIRTEIKSLGTDEQIDLKDVFVPYEKTGPKEVQGSKKKWIRGSPLGDGSEGKVFKGLDPETGALIAVKQIDLELEDSRESTWQDREDELSRLEELSHKGVVKYLAHQLVGSCFYIYMEGLCSGTLAQLIKRYGPLAQALVRRYSKQLLEALVYLHQNKIIHKDIKCANVLVDHEGTVKLSDFGCAKQLDTSASLVANGCGYLKGSVLWMSPERIRESAYGYKSDVWSFGCTVLEMATGKPPWMQYSFDNELAAIWKISQANEQPFVPDSLSAELQELIRACLRLEPGERPSAASLLKHKFFQL